MSASRVMNAIVINAIVVGGQNKINNFKCFAKDKHHLHLRATARALAKLSKIHTLYA